MVVLFSHFAKAGNSCSSADSIALQNGIQVYHQYPIIAGSSNWFKFTPDSTAIVISFKNTFGTSDLINVERLKIHSGNCSSATLVIDTILVSIGNSEFSINGLIAGSSYMLELEMSYTSGNLFALSIYNGAQSPFELLYIGSPNCDFASNEFHCRDNYICNPSFESTYSTAPSLIGTGQLNSNCENWGTPNNGTPDYFNVTGPVTTVGVPINYFSPNPGTAAFDGNAYTGIVCARRIGTNLYRYREYITTQLRAPLKPHKIYRSGFNTILTPTSSFACNNLGMAFSSAIPNNGTNLNGLVSIDDFIFDSNPDVIENNVVTNTTNWTSIRGCFSTIENNIDFVTIGNFADNFSITPIIPLNASNTLVVPTNTPTPIPQNSYAYYFIDQVEVVQLADAGPDATLCPNESLVLGCDPLSDVTYSWSAVNNNPGTNLNQFLSCTDCPTPTFTHNQNYGLNNFSYVVTVTDNISNCLDSDTINVTILNPNNILTGPLTACPPQPGAYYPLIDGTFETVYYSTYTEPSVPFTITPETLYVDWSANDYWGGYIFDVGINFAECFLKIDSIRTLPCCSQMQYSYNNISATELINLLPSTFTDGVDNIFNATFNINGTLLMDQNLTFTNCRIAMGADAKIDENAFDLTLDNTQIRACEFRWLGIENTGGLTKVSNSSTVSDAEIALDFKDMGAIDVSFSTFTHNRIDVFARNINELNPFGDNFISIVGSYFVGNQTIVPPISDPNLIQQTAANLVLRSIPISFFPRIGDPNMLGSINVFSGATVNFLNWNSNIEVNYSRFTNSQIGIYNIGGTDIDLNPYKVTIGNLNPSDENNGPVYFNIFQRNAAQGIYSVGASAISIYDNKFYDSRIGIEIRENDAFPLEIRENRILGSFLTGINLLNNNVDPNGNNYSTHIARNNFITDNNFNLYGDFSVGIVGQSIAGTNDAVNFIQQNSIKGVNFGIVGINTTKMDVSDNRVHLKPDLIFDINYGIGLYGCNSPQVLTNIINSTTTDINVQGIIVDQTMGANLCGNQVVEENTNYQIGTSYVFKGASGAAIFRDNLSNNFTRGIYLGSVAAPMGVQGNSNAASSNRWANMAGGGFHTFCEPAVTGSLNRIFNPSSGPLPIVFGEYWPSGYTWALLSSHFLLQNSAANFTDCGDSEAPSENAERIAYFDDIAKDSTKTIGFSPSRKYIYKEGLSNATLAQPELLSFLPIEEFQDSINTINLGKTCDAKLSFKHHMTEADSLLFLQKVNDLENGTNPENLNKEVLLLLSKNPHIKDSTYTVTEIVRLKQIANYCPYTKGNAVYTARAMLRTINPLDMFYMNNCEKGYTNNGNRLGQLDEDDKIEYENEKVQKEKISGIFMDDILISPNPSREFIKLSGKIDNQSFDNLNLDLLNIDGRIISTIQLPKNRIIDIAKLSNGIYFIRVFRKDTNGFLIAKFIVNR